MWLSAQPLFGRLFIWKGAGACPFFCGRVPLAGLWPRICFKGFTIQRVGHVEDVHGASMNKGVVRLALARQVTVNGCRSHEQAYALQKLLIEWLRGPQFVQFPPPSLVHIVAKLGLLMTFHDLQYSHTYLYLCVCA